MDDLEEYRFGNKFVKNKIFIYYLLPCCPVDVAFEGMLIPGTLAVDKGTETYKLGALPEFVEAAVVGVDDDVDVAVKLPPLAAAMAACAAA